VRARPEKIVGEQPLRDDNTVGAPQVAPAKSQFNEDEAIPSSSFRTPGLELIRDPQLGRTNVWTEQGGSSIYTLTEPGKITVTDNGIGSHACTHGPATTGNDGALEILRSGSTYDIIVKLVSVSITSGTFEVGADLSVSNDTAISIGAGDTSLVYRNANYVYTDSLARSSVFRMVTSILNGTVVVESISVREVDNI
jgi:hypothetical protein